MPEQVVRRLTRVAQGDANLFSQEGLLDMSLLPIIGAFDSERGDVSDGEFIGRVGDIIGKDLDEDSFVNAVGLSIATDPLSFLTAGATVTAKAARSANKLHKNKALAGRVGKADDVAALRRHAKDALATTAAAKDRRGLRKLLAETEPLDDAMALSELGAVETQRQLMVTIPFMERFRSAQFKRLDPEFKNWWQVANRGIGPGVALAGLVSAPLAKLPGIKQVVNQAAGVGNAWSLSKRALGPRVGTSLENSFTGERGEVLQEILQDNDVLFDAVNNKLGGTTPILQQFDETPEALRKMADEVGDKDAAKKLRAQATRLEKQGTSGRFLKAFGRTASRDPKVRQDQAESLWRQLNKGQELPLPETSDELAPVLERFNKEINEAATEWKSRYVKLVGTDSLDAVTDATKLSALGKASFKLFTSARSGLNRMFQTDLASGTTNFLKAEAQFRRDVARASTSYLERAKVLTKAMGEAAVEENMPLDKFETLIGSVLEAGSFSEELEHLSGLALRDPAAYAKSARNMIGRAQSALDTLGVVVKQYGSPEAQQALRGLQIKDVLDEGVANIFTPTAGRRAEAGKPPVPRWGLPHGHKISSPGKYEGDYLGYLSNKELTEALDLATEADAVAINDILDLRRKGLVKQAPRPQAPKVKPDPQGLREPAIQGSAEDANLLGAGAVDHLPEGYLTETGQILADLSSAMHEAGRMTRQGLTVPPSVVRDIDDNLAKFSGWVEDTARQGLGKKANKVFDYMRETQREILKQATRAGTIKAGSPLGYLPRILSNSGRRLLRAATGSIPANVKESLAPQMSGVFNRSLDEYTILELNVLHDEVRKLAPDSDFFKQLDTIAESEGIKVEKFTSSPTEALLERFGQAQRSESTANFIDNMVATGAKDSRNPMRAMRVKGFVDLKGQARTLGKTAKPRSKTLHTPEGDVQTFTNEVVEETRDMKGILLEAEDGTQIELGLDQFREGLAMYVADEGGATIGEAVAARGALGKLGEGFFDRGEVIAQNIGDLAGKQIILGDASTIGGMLDLTSKQFRGGSGFWSGYDRIHGVIKRFQTVYRPDFHIANHLSSVFQTRMIDGVYMKHITGAHMDFMRLIYGDQADIRKALDPAARILGTDGLRHMPSFEAIRATRRVGTAGQKLPRGEFMLRVGDQSHDLAEVIEEMAEQGLMGNFVMEGLRGSSTVAEITTRLRDLAESGGKIRKGLQKAGSKLDELGSSSEDAARVISVFAQLRAGYSIKNAVKQTQQVMVDYSSLNRFESTVAKRAFSFYTFPRKFMPVAWQKFNEDPSSVSAIAHMFGGLETGGQLSTEGGKAKLDLGDDFSINLGRMNAGADAMMMLPGLLAATGLMDTDLEGAPGISEASSFLQLGAPAQLAAGFFDRDMAGDPSLAEEFMSIAPVTEWLMAQWEGGNPDIEHTPLESIADKLLPISKAAPNHRRTVRMARFKALERQLTTRLEDASKRGDAEDMRDLQEDLRALGQTFRAMNQ